MELSRGPAKKQKWMMKKTYKFDYMFFDWATEMPADAFLGSVSWEEAYSWYPDLQKQLKKAEECGGETWYFVLHGQNCGVYKNYAAFIDARDDDMKNGGASKKATRFNSLEEAKAWIQGSRDEEGVHWGWPTTMQIWL